MTATKHSALFSKHKSMGAHMSEREGWHTVAAFTSEVEETAQVRKTAGLADVSWSRKLDLKGPGVKVFARSNTGARTWLLSPGHLLVTSSVDLSNDSPGLWVTDVTSVYAQFLLAGPSSRDILRKLTSLNVSDAALPQFTCGQSSLAHVRAIVLRQDLGSLPAFHLLVNREYGVSVWDAVLHAGHEFHIAPFGMKALESLGA